MPTATQIKQNRRKIERSNIGARYRQNEGLFRADVAANKLAINRHGVAGRADGGLRGRGTRAEREKALTNVNDTMVYDVFGVDPTKRLNKRSRTISAGFELLDTYLSGAGTEKLNNTRVRAELTRIKENLKGGGEQGKLRKEIDAYLTKFPKNRMIRSGQGVGEAQASLAAISTGIRNQFNVDWINEWHGLDLGYAGATSTGTTTAPTPTYSTADILLGRNQPDYVAGQEDSAGNSLESDLPFWQTL